MAELIRVMVVDDSAFVRKVVTQILSRSPDIQVVATARDGEEALELATEHRPDVITLDLVMPRMNGVEFLRAQRQRRAIPVVVCSIADESGALALDALDAGAMEFVQKPTALATDRVYELADELVAKVQAVAHSARVRGRSAAVSAPIIPAPRQDPESARAEIVVIGISTGGPHALREVIPRLPADFPVPVAVVLHMPVGYTALYAERLNQISALEVVEAHEGAVLRPGVVYFAPAGHHLTFVRGGDGCVRAHLDLHPLDTPHRPSANVLFASAADIFRSAVLGVVMTGMGNDGLLGAAEIKAAGGRIVTESESSCVVYGMPRVVAEASLSDRIATVDDMAATIVELI